MPDSNPDKMTKLTKIFISYKQGVENNLSSRANEIRRFLERFPDEYDVWMDKTDLNAGIDWVRSLYETIPRSDIVLVPIAPKTGESSWVPREIDIARGAQVTIVPVWIDGTWAEVEPVLKKFDLDRIQHIDLKEGRDEQFDKLKSSIDKIKTDTRTNQAKWLEALRAGENQPILKRAAETHLSRRIYAVDGHPCQIHLASGDITDMVGIDVVVNPENDYLQMARIFEASSISSRLRLLGSQRRQGHPIRDTLQADLYHLVETDTVRIPVGMGQVIVTHAGHPESELMTKKAFRYIFHVISVKAQPTKNQQNRIQAISDDLIEEAVENVLDAVLEVNEKQGCISPEGSWRYTAEQESRGAYKPIRNLLVPMFATGQGMRQQDIRRVAQSVILGIRDYLRTNPNRNKLQLDTIHVCGYSENDVSIIRSEMDALLN
jgi:TIR domain